MGDLSFSGVVFTQYIRDDSPIIRDKGGDTEHIMRFLWRLLRRFGRKSSGYEITLWPGDKMQYRKVFAKRGGKWIH